MTLLLSHWEDISAHETTSIVPLLESVAKSIIVLLAGPKTFTYQQTLLKQAFFDILGTPRI